MPLHKLHHKLMLLWEDGVFSVMKMSGYLLQMWNYLPLLRNLLIAFYRTAN